jgi:hypothetical protein
MKGNSALGELAHLGPNGLLSRVFFAPGKLADRYQQPA